MKREGCRRSRRTGPTPWVGAASTARLGYDTVNGVRSGHVTPLLPRQAREGADRAWRGTRLVLEGQLPYTPLFPDQVLGIDQARVHEIESHTSLRIEADHRTAWPQSVATTAPRRCFLAFGRVALLPFELRRDESHHRNSSRRRRASRSSPSSDRRRPGASYNRSTVPHMNWKQMEANVWLLDDGSNGRCESSDSMSRRQRTGTGSLAVGSLLM